MFVSESKVETFKNLMHSVKRCVSCTAICVHSSEYTPNSLPAHVICHLSDGAEDDCECLPGNVLVFAANCEETTTAVFVDLKPAPKPWKVKDGTEICQSGLISLFRKLDDEEAEQWAIDLCETFGDTSESEIALVKRNISQSWLGYWLPILWHDGERKTTKERVSVEVSLEVVKPEDARQADHYKNLEAKVQRLPKRPIILKGDITGKASVEAHL